MAFGFDHITHKGTEQTGKLQEKFWTSRGFCSLRTLKKIFFFPKDPGIFRTFLSGNTHSTCRDWVPKITLNQEKHEKVKGKEQKTAL